MRKHLFVALLVLAGHAYAGINANTNYLFNAPVGCTSEATVVDLVPGHSAATITGTLTYVTAPAAPNSGNYMLAGFSSSNYVNIPADVMSGMSNQTAGFIEINGYPTSYTGTIVPISWVDSTWGNMYIQGTNATTWSLRINGTDLSAAGANVPLNTNSNFVFEWEANGHYQLIINGVTGFDNSGFSGTHTITNMKVGYLPAFSCCAFNGYLTQVRFGAGTTSGLPTTDTISCAGSPTNTPTWTPTFTASPTFSYSPTISPTFTITPTPSISPTFTYTPTAGPSPTFQITPAGKSPGVATVPQRGWVAVGVLAGAGYQYISQQAEALVSQGFVAAYTAGGIPFEDDIDSGWSATSRTAGGLLQPNSLFPNMPGTLSYIASLGMVPGLYTDTWTTQCATASGMGSYGSLTADAGTMLSWMPPAPQACELKVDSCGGCQVNPQYDYTLFSNGIYAAAAGRPVDFYLCQSAVVPFDTWTWAGPVGQMWNIDHDVQDDPATVLARFQKGVALSAYNYPGHWNYLGELMVGLGGQTTVQYQKQMKLWCAMPAPLIIEAIIYNGSSFMDATDQAILKNAGALALQANWNGASLHQIANDYAGHVVFYRPITPAGHALVALSNDTFTAQTMSVDLSKVPGMGLGAVVHDIYANADLGTFSGSFSMYVSATGAQILDMAPAPTATPTTTPTVTPTETPACSNQGNLTPAASDLPVSWKMLLKPVTITNGATFTLAMIYVTALHGKIAAGIYDYSVSPPVLVAHSPLYNAVKGWNTIPMYSAPLNNSTYYIAVEGTAPVRVASALTGPDQYVTSPASSWPASITPTAAQANYSIYGAFCKP